MANRVTLACLSSAPLTLPPGTSAAEALDAMRAHWRARLETVLPDRPDLIVLPEYCDRPAEGVFTPEEYAQYLALRGESMLELFAGTARRHRCHIAYSSHRTAPDGRRYNSTRLIDRSGSVAGVYDKNFCTIGENEDGGLTYGTHVPVIELDFGRVAAVICFDLNFEEVRAQVEAGAPDIILFSSAYHGGLMQNYWAYSCQAWLAAAVHPPAPSGVVAPTGEVVAQSSNYRHQVVCSVNLDSRLVHIDRNERMFGPVKRRYGPDVRIHDPGLTGSVLLSAESDDLAVDDVMREYGIEPLRAYWARVRSHRCAHLP